MNNYISNNGENGRDSYFSYYGCNTISYKIRDQAIHSIAAILKSMFKDIKTDFENGIIDIGVVERELGLTNRLIGDFYNDHIKSEEHIKKLFGEKPKTEVTTSELSIE